MVKIFGHPMSTCTRKVLMTLAENDLPYEMNVVDVPKGESRQPAHLHRQPFGRIPAIEDDGFELFESRAICRYLDGKASGKLVPSDPKARARMEQWISIETSEFTPNAMKFVYAYIFKREQPADVMAAATKALETTLGVMDKQLATTPFLAGSEFTLADVCYMPYVDYAIGTPAKEILAKYPHVMTWWNKISERPTWRTASGKA
jgi:glutathione S-transferase